MTEPDLHQGHVTVAKATMIAPREYEGLVPGYQTPSNIVTFQPDVYLVISNDEFLATMEASSSRHAVQPSQPRRRRAAIGLAVLGRRDADRI